MTYSLKQKKSNKKIGATLVETALLISLIAIIAIPSIYNLEWQITCNNASVQAALSAAPCAGGGWSYNVGLCSAGTGPGAPDFAYIMYEMKVRCALPARDPSTIALRNFCHF
jgi:Flp pilus assembly pilin Flp